MHELLTAPAPELPEVSDQPQEDTSAKRGRGSNELFMAMACLQHPATLDEIWRVPPLDQRHRVTIFKLLKRFEAAGVVKRIHMQGQRPKFELISSRGGKDYILCLQCQLLCELGQTDVSRLKSAGEKQRPGWRIVRYELKFYGVCPECQHG